MSLLAAVLYGPAPTLAWVLLAYLAVDLTFYVRAMLRQWSYARSLVHRTAAQNVEVAYQAARAREAQATEDAELERLREKYKWQKKPRRQRSTRGPEGEITKPWEV